MIHYAIQCHGSDLTQVRWLLALLDSADVSATVWHDGPESAAANGFSAGSMRSLRYARSGAITYAGYSQVQALIQAMRHALEQDTTWQWFINLSGTCAPLRPQSFIQAFLREQQRRGILGFLHAFRVRRPVPDLRLDGFDALEYSPIDLKRPRILSERGCRHVFDDASLSPVSNPAMRVHLDTTEILGTRTLYVRAPLAAEIAAKRRFFEHHPHVAGRAWYVLQRDLCEAIVTAFSSIDCAVAHLFQRTMMPDEAALQTWLHTRKDLLDRCNVTDNLRFQFGQPQILTSLDIPRLSASPALFARKIDVRATELLEHVNRTVRSPP